MPGSFKQGGGGEDVLYGVGLGPGDPELVTIKAVRVLEESSLIFVPAPRKEGGGRALSILAALHPGFLGKVVRVEVPMVGGRGGKWDKAASAVLSAMAGGGTFSFVNEGDPLLYGSFVHLLRALRERRPHLRVEVVSGLPSFCAAAAAELVPLASGRDRLVVLPGPARAEELEELLDGHTALVLLKFNLSLHEFRRFLDRNGERVEWWCVENCSLPEERLCRDPALLPHGGWDYFTLVVVKEKAVPGEGGRKTACEDGASGGHARAGISRPVAPDGLYGDRP